MTPAEHGAALAATAPPLTREQVEAAAHILGAVYDEIAEQQEMAA